MENISYHTLRRSSNLFPDRALCITPCVSSNDGGSFIGKSDVISYSEGWSYACKYRAWIAHKVEAVIQKANYEVNEEIVVAFLSANSPEFLLSLIGCFDLSGVRMNGKLRIVPALLNARWSANDIFQALNHSSCELSQKQGIIFLYADGFENVVNDTVKIFNDDESNSHLVGSYLLPGLDSLSNNMELFQDPLPNSTYAFTTGDCRDDAVILFTSGTTKGSKGVRLSHKALTVQALAKMTFPCSYNPSTNVLASVTPLFHIGGLSSSLAVIMASGQLVFFPRSTQLVGKDQLKFRDKLSHLFIKERVVNTLVLVPAMLYILLSAEVTPTYPNIRMILVGGQSMDDRLKELCRHSFPRATIVQTFACTEACSSITFATLVKCGEKMIDPRPTKLSGSYVGMPPPHIQIAIINMEGPKNKAPSGVAPIEKVGYIATRGEHVMSGYWPRGKHETENSFALLGDNWLCTNDYGYVDGRGRLFFCGRSSDTIRSGGETIFAPEVEKLISRMSEVKECAAFPTPDKKFGEIVSVGIVPSDMRKLGTWSDNEMKITIKRFCEAENFARFKIPKRAFLLDELPRNSNGKVQKHLILKYLSDTGYIQFSSSL